MHHFHNGNEKIKIDYKFVVELYESVLYPTHKKIEHKELEDGDSWFEYDFSFDGEEQNIVVVKFTLNAVELNYIQCILRLQFKCI